MASRYIFRRQFSFRSPLRRPLGPLGTHTAKSSLGLRDYAQISADTSTEARSPLLQEIKLINARITTLENDSKTALDDIKNVGTAMGDGAWGVKGVRWNVTAEFEKVRDEVGKVRDQVLEAHGVATESQDGIMEAQNKILETQKKMLESRANIQGKDEKLGLSDVAQILTNDTQKPSPSGSPGDCTQEQILDLLRLVDPNSPIIDGFTLADALDMVGEHHVALRGFLHTLVKQYGKDAEMLKAAIDIQPDLVGEFSELDEVVES